MHIKKTPTIMKRLVDVPSSLKSFVEELANCDLKELVPRLNKFSENWNRPRGDLCPWIPLLNRFDTMLDEAVEKYGLDKPNPDPIAFNPEDEEVLITILNFTAFLLENCSNRGIYSSLKSVACFLDSLSSAVVHAALSVCVPLGSRIAQSQTGRSIVTSIDPNKVLQLASLLPMRKSVHSKSEILLYDFIDTDRVWPEDACEFSMQYYVRGTAPAPSSSAPTAAPQAPATPTRLPVSAKHKESLLNATPSKVPESQAKASQEGFYPLKISAKEVQEQSVEMLLKEIYKLVPSDYRFTAMNRVRLVKACQNTEQALKLRQELVKIQCMAISFSVCIFKQSLCESRVFAKNPNLIKQVADLVSLDHSDVPMDVKVAALQALEFMCNHPIRVGDVFAALSANVSHGILISNLRNCVKIMRQGEPLDESYSVGLLSIIIQISESASASNMMVTAGLLSLLSELIEVDTLEYSKTKAFATELMDHLIIGHNSIFATFMENKGLETLILVLEKQVALVTSDKVHDTPPDFCNVDYRLSYHRSQWVKGLLGLISNTLTHTRTSERVHNLADSSFLQITKSIANNSYILGSRIVSLDIQVLASMLESEQSSYGIMHEAGVIEAVLKIAPDLLQASNSYFVPVARFITSMCHNEGGLKLIQDEKTLSTFFSILSKNMVNNDALKSLGFTFDLLTSDHQELRPMMVSEIIKMIKAFPESLQSVSGPKRFYVEFELVNEKMEELYNKNADIMHSLSNAVTYFEGFLKNHLTRVEFIKQKGVSALLDLFDIPNLPFDFAFSGTSLTLCKILRSLFDLDIESDFIQEEILRKLFAVVDVVEQRIKASDEMDQIVRQENNLDGVLRSLSKLNSFLFAFYQIVFVNPGTGYRIMYVLDKIIRLDSGSGGNIFARLCRIQQWCIWQDARTLDGLPSQFIEASKPVSVEYSTRNYHSIYDMEDAKKIKELETQFEESSSPFFLAVKVYRFSAHANSILTTKILSEFSTICTNDRALSSRRKNGLRMAEMIADALKTHLEYGQIADFSNDTYRNAKYQTVLNLVTAFEKVIFKGWNYSLNVQFGVFIMFKQIGGLESLVNLLKRLWKLPVEAGATDTASSLLVGCQKTILTLLSHTVSYKSILESNRTAHTLNSRETDKDKRSYFNSSQFFIECRIIVLNELLPMWSDDELEKKHYSVANVMVDIMTKMLTFTGEDSHASRDKSKLPRLLLWQNITPSEDKVEAAVEIGFSEQAARNALLKANDNFDTAIAALVSESKEDETSEDIPMIDSKERSFPLPIGKAPIRDGVELATIQDLHDLRDLLKSDLIDRSLNLISSHPENVHSLSSLVIRAFSHPTASGARSEKQKEAMASAHKNVVNVILQALLSFDFESEDAQTRSISAMAHLLALVVQDTHFFQNTFQDLVDTIGLFTRMIESEMAAEKEWYPNVLLIIERLLTNVDVPTPAKKKFSMEIQDIVAAAVPKIDSSIEERIFNTIANVRKYHSDLSALGVARLMVHFTKVPERASLLLNNGSITALLKSFPEFAGSSSFEKLQTALYIILRQAVETPDQIRETMSNEIKQWFSTNKVADAFVFVKAHYHLVARSPELFVEVITESCTLQDTELSNGNVCLKDYVTKRTKRAIKTRSRLEKELKDEKEGKDSSDDINKGVTEDSVKASGEESKSAEQTNSGDGDTEMEDPSKQSANKAESSIPVVENPSGVVQLLLGELFSLKKGDIFTRPEKTEEALKEATEENEKAEFKPGEHPTFMYCCTILHALIELLCSYNKCKLEFLNFSKKSFNASLTGMPLSKPRSYALNFLLHELLPTGTLNESPHMVYQEWHSVSYLASSVLMSLLSATTEKGRKSTAENDIQSEPILMFVRKFTLDTIAKVLRDIHTSVEPVDWRYSMLANLSDFCHRLLSTRPIGPMSGTEVGGDGAAIAKIMYDKKFAPMFTSNLAEIDLNYPHAKWVAKSSIRFLNKLSRLALNISEELYNENREDDLDEEYETDTSEEYREDTPDLFRNSTLGMFDVGETMYDDDEEALEEDLGEMEEEVDEEMEYADHDEVLSDVDDEDEVLSENAIEYDQDDDEDDYDEDSDEEDDEMDVELIVENSAEDDADMDDDDSLDEEDESDWESYEEGDEEDDDDEDIEVIAPADPPMEGLPEVIDPTAPQRDSFFDEEEGDIYGRAGETDIENLLTSSDEPEIDSDEYPEDSDQIYDFSSAIPDRGVGSLMSNHIQSESVSNPLLSQSRRQTRPIVQLRGFQRPESLSAISQMVENDMENGLQPHSISDMFGQFASIFSHNIPSPTMELSDDLEFLIRGFSRNRQNDIFAQIMKVTAITTNARWEEAAVMFGVYNKADVAGRIIYDIFNRMYPYALKQKEELDAINEDIHRLSEEIQTVRDEKEQAKRREEERITEQKRKEEEEEKARLAKQKAEEKEKQRSEDEDTPMANTSEAEPSNEERVFVTISGRDVDITGMGIDPTFLEALPADIREEAFTQHLRDLQSQERSGGEVPRQLEPEFLDALPENIRQELLEQEALENRLSEGNGQGPVEMDLASFLATLDPSLRQTLLLEQDDISLSNLPPEIAEEARGLRSRTVATFPVGGTSDAIGGIFTSRRRGHGRRAFDISSDESENEDENGEVSPEEKKNRKIISAAALHLVDKSGIAALLRLLYLPQSESQLGSLNQLLLNLCSNRQSRLDILHLLLHVLQDGSCDRHSLERGFVQTSNRARQAMNTPSKNNSNAYQPPGSVTPKASKLSSQDVVLSEDTSPFTVMSQALNSLESLVANSTNIKYFFVTEHDAPIGYKRDKKQKKGKGKERDPPKEWKFPVNLLINMLDRKAFRESTVCLEKLASLLHEVTRFLPAIVKVESQDTSTLGGSTEQKSSNNAASQEDVAEGPEGAVKEAADGRQDSKRGKRSHKMIDPPYIPEYNLKRISNIIAAKECSSKTFQQTLGVMQHLTSLPGVKEFFGKELLKQAMALGPAITKALKELLTKVKVAEKGSDLDESALVEFSSASSDQAQLLRVLTAIDYLFDASRQKGAKRDEGEKYLKNLYESMTFGPLWNSLSNCLLMVQDRQDMIHVATALLPLIEALMVICKHSSVKDVQIRGDKYEARRSDFEKEPLESLFFSFTDEHRKILNQIVRNNPKLMIGSFSILVKNPKVLEFDNKRKYFYRKIYPENEPVTHSMSLNVRRDQVFLDSYKTLYFKAADEIKHSRLNVKFQGEEGVDAGGVTREWYQVLSRQMFNPDYALFTPVASDKTTFHPNRTSWVNPEHLSFFKFIGRIIGKAIYDGRVLDCHFSRAVYKKILGKTVNIKDMESLDLEYYKSLVWMLDNDITDIITETFSIEAEDYGEQKVIDLKPDGRNIPVTEENKKEYVNLVVEYRLLTSIKEQMEHFLQGFHDIIPKDVVAIFDEQELELLISGMPDIDLDDWKNNTEYHNYSASSPQIKWFWRAVRSFDAEEKAKLLQFATGTSKVPLNGFSQLEGMNGVQKFNVHRDYGSKDRLPSSHTCFNQIDLPEYDSYETLRGSLLMAISEGREGFGFA
ncbi:E3 ubiquitin-protein ligase Tom1p [Trichomonascus vanleenenianus]|uniref:E3 ubiquitin-protein ligase TOM1 n=1 Tax=Trichomonascus vanleenenianus TaxID=2268995 RepID=UPI003ECA1038